MRMHNLLRGAQAGFWAFIPTPFQSDAVMQSTVCITSQQLDEADNTDSNDTAITLPLLSFTLSSLYVSSGYLALQADVCKVHQTIWSGVLPPCGPQLTTSELIPLAPVPPNLAAIYSGHRMTRLVKTKKTASPPMTHFWVSLLKLFQESLLSFLLSSPGLFSF